MWLIMYNYENFTKILLKLRKEKGLTQENLAEKANMNGKYFGRIERGSSDPTMKKVFKICNALEIKPSEFMKQIEKFRN